MTLDDDQNENWSGLTRVQRDNLEIYKSLLFKWQPKLNLVSHNTLQQAWRRHFVDCLQLIPLAGKWDRWVDLGSGAGFPGMIVAIMSEGRDVHLIESDKRKASFLAEVSRETGVRAHIHVERIERVLPEITSEANFDVVSARGLASMRQLLFYAEPVLSQGGRGIFLKGKELSLELTNDVVKDTFTYELVDSMTEPGAKIVIVRQLKA